MYATTGDRFVYGNAIHFSIVPDGTNVGGQPSNLYATMDKIYGANVWEHYVFDAAACWESVANINLVWVNDNGAAIGSGNYQQGDPNYGDIRIGGYAQDPNTMAFTFLPPQANGTSLSGDMFINTNLPWGGQYGYDLETTLIHEFGHALGMAHSADQNAAMYAVYTGFKDYPTQDDINGIQSIWGPRPEDSIAQANANFTMAHAANLNSSINTQNNQIVLPNMDIAKLGETYWFKVTTPANASNVLAVVLQSDYLSLLSGRIQIFDANGNGLAQATDSVYSYGDFAMTQINNATPNTTYYIRTLASQGVANGSGSYALFVNMGTGTLIAQPPAYTVVANQPSQGGGAWGETSPTSKAGKAELRTDDFVRFGNTVVPADKLMIAPKLMHKQAAVAVQTKQHHPTRRVDVRQLVDSKQHHKTIPA